MEASVEGANAILGAGRRIDGHVNRKLAPASVAHISKRRQAIESKGERRFLTVPEVVLRCQAEHLLVKPGIEPSNHEITPSGEPLRPPKHSSRVIAGATLRLLRDVDEHVRAVALASDGEAKVQGSGDEKPVSDVNVAVRINVPMETLSLMLVAIAGHRARDRPRLLLCLQKRHSPHELSDFVRFDHATARFFEPRVVLGKRYTWIKSPVLVVSQRTALVSKTILSQCNTFFAHSLIDQTSLTFLESVFSHEHVKVIPNLKFLEFLAFGKAVQVERPVLLRREFDAQKKAASEALNRPLAEQNQ